ncbi:MAG: hypothetical protein EAZ08_02905 [Cytophagales bacterium]|nr:MAG: hypothetical protein EAZ08_02905 [Cytophagales bacterium]
MNNSTEGVTLLAAFINDVISEVSKLNIDMKDLLAYTEGYDVKNIYNHVPITIYNDMCAWVEDKLGEETLKNIGRNIGETVYSGLLSNGIIQEDTTPLALMEGLVIAASAMINDPQDRGWEIINSDSNSLEMRRTQTFNSKLQLGLLRGLMEKCPKVKTVSVSYTKEIAKGDKFDQYLVRWS